MACVYNRGTEKRPNWWVSWGSGKTRKWSPLGPGVRSKTDAEAARHEIERDLSLERDRQSLPGFTSFGDALDDFLREKRNTRAEWTSYTYDKHAKHFRRMLPVTLRIGRFTARQIRAYLSARAAATSKITADKERTTLAVFWKWAIRQGLAKENPVLAVAPYGERSEEPDPCPRGVLADHLRALRTDAKAHAHPADVYARRLYADVLRVLWHTGLRIGELCSWTAESVDLELGALRVKAKAHGKAARLVPIPRCLMRLFRRRLAFGHERVFATHEGGAAYNALFLFRRRWLRSHPEHAIASFHRLRHAMATRGDEAGVDRAIMSRGLLGHETVQTTERYTHRTVERLRLVQEQIGAFEREGRIQNARKRTSEAAAMTSPRHRIRTPSRVRGSAP